MAKVSTMFDAGRKQLRTALYRFWMPLLGTPQDGGARARGLASPWEESFEISITTSPLSVVQIPQNRIALIRQFFPLFLLFCHLVCAILKPIGFHV
jgi:hypothetical protein